jgi:hypothetical protein
MDELTLQLLEGRDPDAAEELRQAKNTKRTQLKEKINAERDAHLQFLGEVYVRYPGAMQSFSQDPSGVFWSGQYSWPPTLA